MDGDGVNDLAVGADGDDAGGSNRGTVNILYMVGIFPANAPTSLTASVTPMYKLFFNGQQVQPWVLAV